MQRQVNRRQILTVALAGTLLSAGLSGCGFGRPGAEKTVDYGNVSDAVMTAVPRIVKVEDLDQSMNGFGHRFSLGLELKSAEPFTVAELDTLIKAIWLALPWEPNTISMTAGTDTRIVDLRAAAAQLSPLGVTNAGQGGVSLTGMTERYGAWKAPE